MERIDTVDQMMGHTSDKVMLNTGENEKKESILEKTLQGNLLKSGMLCVGVYIVKCDG